MNDAKSGTLWPRRAVRKGARARETRAAARAEAGPGRRAEPEYLSGDRPHTEPVLSDRPHPERAPVRARDEPVKRP